jgi:hypothetical protein
MSRRHAMVPQVVGVGVNVVAEASADVPVAPPPSLHSLWAAVPRWRRQPILWGFLGRIAFVLVSRTCVEERIALEDKWNTQLRK